MVSARNNEHVGMPRHYSEPIEIASGDENTLTTVRWMSEVARVQSTNVFAIASEHSLLPFVVAIMIEYDSRTRFG